jgi:hypothetical protein
LTLAPEDSADLMAAEQQLLGFLVGESSSPETVREILEQLKDYRFQSIEHQVLFECVSRHRAAGGGDPLGTLPARLVVSGFPDFDLEQFTAPSSVNAEEARRLSHFLLRGGGSNS